MCVGDIFSWVTTSKTETQVLPQEIHSISTEIPSSLFEFSTCDRLTICAALCIQNYGNHVNSFVFSLHFDPSTDSIFGISLSRDLDKLSSTSMQTFHSLFCTTCSHLKFLKIMIKYICYNICYVNHLKMPNSVVSSAFTFFYNQFSEHFHLAKLKLHTC